MTGRRSHGRLSALNGVVHQGSAGLELGGGLRYRVPQVGLTAEGYGRWLAVHEGALQEWGVGAMPWCTTRDLGQ